LDRWNFAKAIANNSITGTFVDLTRLVSQPESMVSDLAQAVLARTLPNEIMAALQPLADANKPSVLAALLIGSPLFQLRG
jgi:predicted anti-sigma-YlaC factor YlaD